jgi:putative ATP-binding cassette transporter
MQIFLFLIRHSPRLFLLSMVTGVISGLSSAELMALLNNRLTELTHPPADFLEKFLGLALLALGSQLGSRLILLWMATHAVRSWRVDLSRQLLHAPLRNIERQGASGLMATLTSDIGEVSEALIKFPVHCVNIVIIGACFSYLFWLSWEMALCFFGIMALGVAVHQLIIKSSRRHLQGLRDAWDRLIELFTAVVEGNKELKLHRGRRARFMHHGIAPTADEMMRYAFRFNSVFAVAEVSGQLFFFTLLLSIPLMMTALEIKAEHIVTGFVLMLLYMSGRIAEFVGTVPVFQKADVAKKKIESLGMLLGTEAIQELGESGQREGADWKELQLRNVEYQYEIDDEDSSFRLGPLNLSFVPGEIVFVIGGNGSGKSSFARLLTGLYPPSCGSILFDGEEVNAANRGAYRENFSTVFSDFHLFKRLYEELSPEMRARAQELLEILQLGKKVRLDADTFSTVDLSQGQRKRLALLTSFLENRRIYLFDEWAADQDPGFKQVFYNQILPELCARGKAVIIVSHDDHYYYVAHRLVRFDEGRVIEDRRVQDLRLSTAAAARELHPVCAT